MPCKSSHLLQSSNEQLVTSWIALWSSCCLLSTLISLVAYLTNTYRFQYPILPIVYIAICYLFIATGYIIRLVASHETIACDNFVPNKKLIDNLDNMNNTQLEIKIFRSTKSGRLGCALTFVLIHYFSMASAVWWIVLTWTWFLAAAFKWSSEAILKYSQVYHFFAWSLPACQTLLAFLIAPIEGNRLSGTCSISIHHHFYFIMFEFVPRTVYLLVGILLLIAGFFAVIRIRDQIKFQQPRLMKIYKLDKLMLRLGLFGLVYTIPNLAILFGHGYALYFDQLWYYGSLCQCRYSSTNSNFKPDKPFEVDFGHEFGLFMVQQCMYLIIGILSACWIWSSKTWSVWKMSWTRTKVKQVSTLKKSNYLRKYPNGNFVLLNNSNSSSRGLLNNSNLVEYPDPNGASTLVSGHPVTLLNSSLYAKDGADLKNTYDVIGSCESPSVTTASCVPSYAYESSQWMSPNYPVSMMLSAKPTNDHFYYQPQFYPSSSPSSPSVYLNSSSGPIQMTPFLNSNFEKNGACLKNTNVSDNNYMAKSQNKSQYGVGDLRF